MGIVELILHITRKRIEALGVPPDALQDALAEIEESVRRSCAGGPHYISRLPSTKARILDHAELGLTPQQIAQRLGVTDRYVRRVLEAVRAPRA